MKLPFILAGLALTSAVPLQANLTTTSSQAAEKREDKKWNCHLLFSEVGWRDCPHYDKKCGIGGNLLNKVWDTLEVECIARGDTQWCDPFWLKTPDNKFIPDIFFERVCAAGPKPCPSKDEKYHPPRDIWFGHMKPNHHMCVPMSQSKRDINGTLIRPYLEPDSITPLIP